MTQLTVDVELDEQGQPVFRLTEAQAAALGLQIGAAREARWEVEAGQSRSESPFRKYVGIAPRLPEGSVTFHHELRGYDE